MCKLVTGTYTTAYNCSAFKENIVVSVLSILFLFLFSAPQQAMLCFFVVYCAEVVCQKPYIGFGQQLIVIESGVALDFVCIIHK